MLALTGRDRRYDRPLRWDDALLQIRPWLKSTEMPAQLTGLASDMDDGSSLCRGILRAFSKALSSAVLLCSREACFSATDHDRQADGIFSLKVPIIPASTETYVCTASLAGPLSTTDGRWSSIYSVQYLRTSYIEIEI